MNRGSATARVRDPAGGLHEADGARRRRVSSPPERLRRGLVERRVGISAPRARGRSPQAADRGRAGSSRSLAASLRASAAGQGRQAARWAVLACPASPRRRRGNGRRSDTGVSGAVVFGVGGTLVERREPAHPSARRAAGRRAPASPGRRRPRRWPWPTFPARGAPRGQAPALWLGGVERDGQSAARAFLLREFVVDRRPSEAAIEAPVGVVGGSDDARRAPTGGGGCDDVRAFRAPRAPVRGAGTCGAGASSPGERGSAGRCGRLRAPVTGRPTGDARGGFGCPRFLCAARGRRDVRAKRR